MGNWAAGKIFSPARRLSVVTSFTSGGGLEADYHARKFMKIKHSILLWLAPLVLVASLPAAQPTFTVSPATVSNTFPGNITLLISNVPTGDPVVVQKFLDLNTNGAVDGTDWLVQQFSLTDGQAGMAIAGVTNFNVPGDANATTGLITATLNLQGDFMQRIAGKYLFRLTSPVGHFTPVTNLFTVTNFPFGQKFAGNVVSNGTATTVSNALVLLFPAPRPGNNGPSGNPLAGVVANNSGAYSVAAPPGTYTLVAFRSNYLANLTTAPVLTLTNLANITNNLTLTNATAYVGGKLADAASPGTGLPGILVPVQSTNGMLAGGMTDTNGNFSVGVRSGNWQAGGNDVSLVVHGYLGLQNKTNVPAGTLTVTNLLSRATALIYGSVKDNFGNPLAGVDVYVDDGPGSGLYQTDGYTDTNGNYVVGIVGGSDSWWQQVDNSSAFTNYVFSQSQLPNNGVIASNTAVLQNFTGILATNRIAGNVKFNGTNVAGVSVWANATINGTNYQTGWLVTDTGGNYALNVCNGSWTLGLNCSGGNSGDSLDSILGAVNYVCPNNPSMTISNNNATNNFIIQPCGGVQILTTNLPNGEVNVPYGQTLQAASCNSSFTWTNISGSLPSGLSLDSSSGTLSGTPGAGGAFNFTIRVTDGSSHTTNQPFSIGISNALQITTSSLPNGTNGSAYNQQLLAGGGLPPYNSWLLVSGSLPTSLNLSTNGLLSGTAATSGTFNFTVGLTDSLGGNASQPFSLTLNSLNPTPPPPMGITSAGGQLFICYPTAGSNFVLQTATNVNGPWTPASNVSPAISFQFTNGNPAQFFRLQ